MTTTATTPAAELRKAAGAVPEREIRTAYCSQVELRAEGDAPKIIGYAAVYNSETELYPGMREVVRPGAFDRALGEKQDVRALFNHDSNRVLGRSGAGTLRLASDAKGLRVEIMPPEHEASLLASMRRGDISQMSFAFRIRKQAWSERRKDDGTYEELRELLDVDLMDVSVVTYPAYEATEASVRSAFLLARDEVTQSQQADSQDQRADQLGAMKRRLKLAEMRTRLDCAGRS